MTTLYVPLGANARSLLAGQPSNRFDSALKFWSLWYDRVILEEGVWLGRSGPTGPYEMHTLPLQVLAGAVLEAAKHGAGDKHAWVSAFYRLSSLHSH